MKKRLLLSAFLFFGIFISQAQVNENFDSGLGGFTASGGASATTGQACSGTQSLVFTGNGQFVYSPAVTDPLALTFNTKRSGNTAAFTLNVEISDPGSTTIWTTIRTLTLADFGTTCGSYPSINLSAYTGVRRVRFTDARATGAAQRAIDDVVITANVSQLSLSAAARTGFTYVAGNGPSASQNYTLSGSTLSPSAGNITVTGSTNYEISTDNVTFANSATVAYTGGALAATTLHVRLKAGRGLGAYNSETISHAGGGATTINVTASGSVTASAATDVVGVASSGSATVSSLLTGTISTVADGAQVWQMDIRDGGAGLNDADNLPSIVTGFTLTQNAGNAVNDWSDAIQSIALFDGSTLVTALATISITQIVFSGMSLSISDNTSKQLSVRLTLQTSVDNVSPGTNNDGDDFVFSLTAANLALSGTGSGKNTGAAVASSTNGQNILSVVATKLAYGQQPTTSSVNASMSPAVTVRGVDVNGNVDMGFAGSVSIASSGTLLSAPVTVAASSGVATFSLLKHTATGTGFALTATASGLTAATSATFDIVVTTTFEPGDLVMIGYDNNTTGGDDFVQFLSFVPIITGTAFQWTNATYETGGYPAANLRTDKWYSCVDPPSGIVPYLNVTYTGASTLPAGTVICLSTDNGGSGSTATAKTPAGASSTGFTVAGKGSDGSTLVSHTSVNVSTSGPDAMFITQGIWVNVGGSSGYTTFTGNVLGGVQDGAAWYDLANNLSAISGDNLRRSRIHPQIRCSYIQANTTPGTYVRKYNNTTTTGSQATILSAILDFGSNWSSSTPSCPSSSPFTISSSASIDTWTGAVNTNWFDCRNWSKLTVPDQDTDVRVEAASTRDAVVDYTAANSDDFGDIAECRDLTITGKRIALETSASNVLYVYGNLAMSGGTLDMNGGGADDGQLYLYGNWTNTATTATFDEGTKSYVHFAGTSQQTVISSDPTAEDFASVEVNNASHVSLQSMVRVNNQLKLTGGNVQTTASDNLLLYNAASVSSTANNAGIANMGKESSFVDGPMTWQWTGATDERIFPTGAATTYGPIAVEPRNNASKTFTAQYFANGYGAYTVDAAQTPPLDHVSLVEWWDIQCSLNNATNDDNAKIRPYWRTASAVSAVAADRDELRVAHFTGTNWKQEGNSPAITNTAQSWGSVQSDWFASFSPVTLGTQTSANTLPVELLAFTAVRMDAQTVNLEWLTATEQNTDYFAIERSEDGEIFEEMSQVAAYGNTIEMQSYRTTDDTAQGERYYYRLRIADQDGGVAYSQVVQVAQVVQAASAFSITVMQNPVSTFLCLSVTGVDEMVLVLCDVAGKVLYNTGTVSPSPLTAIPVAHLAAGIYFCRLEAEGRIYTARVVKE